MKFIPVALVAALGVFFALAQQPAAATEPVAIVKKEEAKKAPEPTCEKKDMKNGKCPKVFPKAPKPSDKQLEDAKKKAEAKK
jgi:hypothetical protein